MYLKSLELFGFKSFADKTQLSVEPGITVVIGPNGCGKSNIVDGFRWVLGEKQAKNIRGDKMEDIIFNGTESRKPLSLADVSIIIDNTNKILDIDSDSVRVSRRLYRDGESEYLINKTPVRLKDIEKLFMDTGIGKASYSIMEQGKIDMILSTRPDDRRYFFEEAAGISKFKLQKKESERKLQSTADNLARINDVIREIERERNTKSGQAEKTKEYISLKKRLSDFDIRLSCIKYKDNIIKRDKLKEEIEELKKEREKISARISTISADNERDEKLKNEIQLKLFEVDKEIHEYIIKSADIDNKTEKNRNLMKEEYNRREKIKHMITERAELTEKLKEEKSKHEYSAVVISERLENDSERLKNQIELRKKINDDIASSKVKIENNKKRIKAEEENLKGLRNELEVIIRKLVDAIEKRKAELSGSESERLEVRTRINDNIDKIIKLVDDAQKHLTNSRIMEAAEAVRMIDMHSLKIDIARFENFEDGFRSILFDKTGIHAEKERLDATIREKVLFIEDTRYEIDKLEDYVRDLQTELESVNQSVTDLEKIIIRNENEFNWIEKHLHGLIRQLDDISKLIENYKEDITASERSTENLLNEIREWGNMLVQYNEKSEVLKKSADDLVEKRAELEQKIIKRKETSRKDIESQERIVERTTAKEMSLVEIDFKANNIEEYLWTEYERKIADLANVQVNLDEKQEIEDKLHDVKSQIHDLGPINNLAIEEYKELQQRFEYYSKQKDDIEKARQDILSVIEDINKTSIEMFISTFEQIRVNFGEVFKKLFEGGDALVELTDLENVLESGIEITARPPGKKPKNISILSGGERTLTAIALLFATYMVRPSPFCLLDEIDAALDEENVGRFLRMLQQFAKTTQFVIITHNKKTMSIGDCIYGITMEDPGVSKILSYKMVKGEAQVAT